MSTATAIRPEHHNTDRSHAYCHCSLGHDHGNLPIEDREQILRLLLRHHDFALISDRRGTMIVKTVMSPSGWATRAHRLLTSYGLNPRYEVMSVSGVYVVAEAFNR